MNKQKKKLRKPKFRPSKRTQNRFVIAFQRANTHFLDGIEREILFNEQNCRIICGYSF
jgi:hypothetical protein